MRTRLWANCRALSIVFMKDARPTLTSSTRALIFSAAFFEIIDAVNSN